MSIYAVSDLHLSFNADKPMDIFGWQDYENKIKEDWESKVKEDDLVILGGGIYEKENYINNSIFN